MREEYRITTIYLGLVASLLFIVLSVHTHIYICIYTSYKMATFTADDVNKQIELYREKLEQLKIKKLKKYDNINNNSNNEKEREAYIEKLDNIIETRIIDAESKANKLLQSQNNVNKYNPYKVLNLSDDKKLKKKQEYHNKNNNNSNATNNNNLNKDTTTTSSIKWSQLFENPNLPLVIDAGCGSGKFLLRFAWEGNINNNNNNNDISIKNNNMNFLGIEIRKGLVDIAMNYRNTLGYEKNVCYIHSEFNTKFILENLSKYPGKVNILCCQMPDPRFKKNMKRRGKKKLTLERIIQPSLVSAIGTVLDPINGVVYVSSEYEEVHLDMKECFLNNKKFRLANMTEINELYFARNSSQYHTCSEANTESTNLISNPFGCETERELYLRENKQNMKIWRMVFHLNND